MGLEYYYNKLKSILGLSLSLAKADFKLRNEGSYLGILWYLLEPLSLFIIILFLRGSMARSDIEFYPLYLLMGLIMFNFFIKTTSQATSAIIGNSAFIKSIKISYESLVISRVIQGFYSHFFELILFAVFMVFIKGSLIGLIFYPLILFFFILFILGISFFLSAIGVYVHDLTNVWGVLTRLFFFVIPIFYIVDKNSLISLLNPVYYFILISRELVIYSIFPELWRFLLMIFFSLLFLVIGFIVFEKLKDKFAELV